MSKGARSVFVFGLYLGALGIFLLTAPNILFGIFQLPSTNEVWIRVAGMLLLLLGVYYVLAARKELTEFVYVRASVILFLTPAPTAGAVYPAAKAGWFYGLYL